jgi:hypothetical protein
MSLSHEILNYLRTYPFPLNRGPGARTGRAKSIGGQKPGWGSPPFFRRWTGVDEAALTSFAEPPRRAGGCSGHPGARDRPMIQVRRRCLTVLSAPSLLPGLQEAIHPPFGGGD